MTTNNHKKLLFLFLCLLFFLPLGNAQDSSSTKNRITVAPLVSTMPFLYIQNKKNYSQRMIKSNAMLTYFSKEDSIQTVAEYHTCNEKGMFISKFHLEETSTRLNKRNPKKKYYKKDTIVSFVEFESIYMFGFRNYYNEKIDINLVIGMTGIASIIGSIVLAVDHLTTYQDLSNLDDFTISTLISGVVLTGYGTWRLLRMKKMRMRSMDKFRFYLY